MKYAEKKEEIRQQAINFQFEIISEKITDFWEIEEKRNYFEKVGKNTV